MEIRGPAHGTAMREPCLEIKDNIIRFILAQINDLIPNIRQAEFLLSTKGNFILQRAIRRFHSAVVSQVSSVDKVTGYYTGWWNLIIDSDGDFFLRYSFQKHSEANLASDRKVTGVRVAAAWSWRFLLMPMRIMHRDDDKRPGPLSTYGRGVMRTYLLTYLLTPWGRVLLEKLTSKLCS